MSLPYYQMYPKDFNGAEEVRMMSLAAVGLYILCVNHAWAENGIPSDPETLVVALGLTGKKAKEARKVWTNEVRQKFPVSLADGRLSNTRVEREREKAQSKSVKRSGAALSRWAKLDANADANAEILHMHGASPRASGCVSDSESVSEKKEIPLHEIRDVRIDPPESKKPAVTAAELFDPMPSWERLWALDPYSTGHNQARDKFLEIIDSSVHPERIAPSMVESRKRWLDYCSAINSKALGTLKWLDSGDFMRAPPKAPPSKSNAISDRILRALQAKEEKNDAPR